jgi:hypothetical protein
MKKDRISKEEILEQLNQAAASIVDKTEPPVKPRKARGSSDLGNRYKFAYKEVYNNLPEWKQQVIDDKKYNDRIYNEYIKEVISQAEQKQAE